ncbi:MAG: hypothetical protein EA428_02690, partial [Spirochaetaceae bacterium]
PGVLGSSIVGSAAADRQFGVVIAVYSVGAVLAAIGLIHRKRIEKWIFRLSRPGAPDLVEPTKEGTE